MRQAAAPSCFKSGGTQVARRIVSTTRNTPPLLSEFGHSFVLHRDQHPSIPAAPYTRRRGTADLLDQIVVRGLDDHSRTTWEFVGPMDNENSTIWGAR